MSTILGWFDELAEQVLLKKFIPLPCKKSISLYMYAIGEIVLVVVGIIIALQINNWNENQKNKKAENQALISLKLEFDENQIRLDQLIERRKSQEKQCRTYPNLITDATIPISQKIITKTPSTLSSVKCWVRHGVFLV